MDETASEVMDVLAFLGSIFLVIMMCQIPFTA